LADKYSALLATRALCFLGGLNVLVEVQARNRITQLREERGLTTKQLAELAKMPVATIIATELPQREPRFSTARRIAEALGVNVAELYT
jgi:DNA-binding XRE family transcriptional regulator